MEDKTLLLGLHNYGLLEAFYDDGELYGYQVDSTRYLEDMLDQVRSQEYSRYIMDANLGLPNSPDVTSAVRVYELVKRRVEQGEAQFIAISSNEDAVTALREKEIPVESKQDFWLRDFLMRSGQKYFDRTLRLKPKILANQDMIERISMLFRFHYGPESVDNQVMEDFFIGQGETHVVYSVGKVKEPLSSQVIPVALRMSHIGGYVLDEDLAGEIGSFEHYFECGKCSVPYFIAAVQYDGEVAMLTEDLSEAGKHVTKRSESQDFPAEFLERQDSKGNREVFFVDPLLPFRCVGWGKRYLEDEARIDID